MNPGPVWRRDRKMVLPNYGRRAVEAYTEVFNREADLLVESLKALPSGQTNIYKQIVQCTTFCVCGELSETFSNSQTPTYFVRRLKIMPSTRRALPT